MEANVYTVGPESVAFITGGAHGIGLSLARAVVARGGKVALTDVNASALEAAAAELAPTTNVCTYQLDVRDRARFADVADAAEQALGPVNLLFNNAGIATGRSVTQVSYADWDWVLGVNLDGVVNGIQTFLPRMLGRAAPGYVVNTSSGAGLVATDAGFLYTTSKFAVVGMSETLQMELARYGIGVSVLCPGPVATNILENTRRLAADEQQSAAPQAPDTEAEPVQSFLSAGVHPDRVAELVMDGIAAGRLHIFTDDLIRGLLVRRQQVLLDALP